MEFVFAYIDPGSGSLIVQALIAGLIAIPFFFRNQISRAVRTLRGKSHPGATGAAPADDSSPKA